MIALFIGPKRVAPQDWFPYNCCSDGTGRAVSSVVRAPRSHRGGRRFKSSIAHHLGSSRQGFPWCRAEVAKRQTRCVQGAVSLWTCGFKSLPRHQKCPGFTSACSSVDRALPCGGRGRGFESRQARHFFGLCELSLQVSTSLPLCATGG